MDHLFQLHTDTLFLRRDALAVGYDDRDLQRACATGVLAKVRHGTYIAKGVWEAADEVQRYVLRGRGAMLTHGQRVALSHTSAAAEYGLALFRPDLRHIHLTRVDGGNAGIRGDIRYHAPDPQLHDLVWDGHRLLVAPVRAALGTAVLHDQVAGVVVLDSLLHHDLATLEHVVEAYRQVAHHPWSRSLQIVVRLARDGAHSAFESQMRMFFWYHHIPPPELQFNIYDEHGHVFAVTDFAWPAHGLLGEADGRVKYGRSLQPGQDPADVLWAEKQREDAIREITGMRMIRYVHQHLYVPQETQRRTRRMLGLLAA